jgi:hypothetical protein
MRPIAAAGTIAGLVVVLLLTPVPAQACSCAPPDADTLMETADVVFVGSPTRLVLEAEGPQGTERLWEFAVAGVYRGDVSDGLAVSGGSGGGAGCEVAFHRGYGNVAVAARWSAGHLRTGLCSVMPAADFVLIMGPGQPPALLQGSSGPFPSGGPPIAILALGIASLGLAVVGLGAIVWSRRSVATSEGDQ